MGPIGLARSKRVGRLYESTESRGPAAKNEAVKQCPCMTINQGIQGTCGMPIKWRATTNVAWLANQKTRSPEYPGDSRLRTGWLCLRVN